MVVVMADVDITSLSVEISAESQGAELNIDKLATAISNLRTKGNVTKVVNSLDRLAGSIATLKQASAGMSGLDKITSFLNGLSNVNTTASAKSINTVVNAIKKIPAAVSGLNGVDFYSMSGSITQLTNALAPLSILDASNLKALGSAFNAIGKVPDLTDKLKATDLDSFASSCQKISAALAPLASQLDKVGNAFAKLPPQLSKVVTQANRVTTANEKQRKSYLSLSNQMNGFMRNMAKLVSLKAIAEYLGNAVAKFNDFYEATDLFHDAMGNLSGEADTLISKMQGLLGVDPTKAMTYMATIQSLGTSFGLTSDKAYILSKNLTQLAYDEGSYWNKDVAETFTAMSSAISGEIEPIRRLGVDLSQARLQQELLALGFNKQVSSLSQADKAVLRYIAIMKQTANVQGNLAQTIQSPANQIKILKAQLDMLAKSVGSLLYPAMKSILPPLIAAVQLIREFVEWVAKLMGVKVVFTDFTKSADSVGGIGDAMDNTADSTKKAAKALKDYTMGFDELNIIDPNKGKKSSSSGVAGNILGDVDLSGYDMFKNYVGNAVDEIKEKVKKLLPIIAGVAAGFAAWEISTALLTALETISTKGGLIKAILSGINPVVAMIAVAFALAAARLTELYQNSEAFRKGIERVRDILKSIKEGFVNGFMSSFTDGKLGEAINHLKESFENLKETIWNLLPESVQKALSEFSEFVEKLNLDFTDLAVTIVALNSLNPVLLLFEAFTVVLRALGVISDEDSTKMKTGLVGAFESVGKAVADAFGIVIDWFASATDWFAKLPETASKMVEDVSNWFAKLPESIAYHLGFVAGKIVAWAANMVSTAATEVPKIPEKIISFFAELPGKIYANVSGAYQTVVNWASGMKNKAREVIPAVIDSFVSFFAGIPGKLKALGTDIVDGLYNGVKDAMSMVVNKVGQLADSFVQGFKDALGIASPSKVFHEIGVFIDQGLANGVNAALLYVEQAMNNLANAVQEKGNELIDYGSSVATGFVDNVVNTLDSKWNEIDSGLKNDFVGTIKSMFEAVKNGDIQTVATNTAAIIWQAMGEENRSQVKSYVSNLISTLTGALKDVGAKALVSAKSIGKNILTGITSKFGEIASQAVGLGSKLTSTFSSLTGPLATVGKAISTGLSSGVLSQFPSIIAGVAGLIGQVGTAFMGLLQTIGGVLTSLGIPTGVLLIAGGIAIAAAIAGIVGSLNSKYGSNSSVSNDYSSYPGTSGYDSSTGSTTSTGSYYPSSSTSGVSASDLRSAVHDGCYNAFLDIFQRYGDEITGGKEIKLFIDGKQITASVERQQADRGVQIMGTEVYSY
jgi:hypothetical protein